MHTSSLKNTPPDDSWMMKTYKNSKKNTTPKKQPQFIILHSRNLINDTKISYINITKIKKKSTIMFVF